MNPPCQRCANVARKVNPVHIHTHKHDAEHTCQMLNRFCATMDKRKKQINNKITNCKKEFLKYFKDLIYPSTISVWQLILCYVPFKYCKFHFSVWFKKTLKRLKSIKSAPSLADSWIIYEPNHYFPFLFFEKIVRHISLLIQDFFKSSSVYIFINSTVKLIYFCYM